MEKSKINLKVFTSFILAISFILISISGIVLYIAPRGRIAHWINWSVFGFSKEDWEAIHTVFVSIFPDSWNISSFLL